MKEMFFSSYFYLALILEEIALESNNKVTETRLLGCAERLHLDALILAK